MCTGTTTMNLYQRDGTWGLHKPISEIPTWWWWSWLVGSNPKSARSSTGNLLLPHPSLNQKNATTSAVSKNMSHFFSNLFAMSFLLRSRLQSWMQPLRCPMHPRPRGLRVAFRCNPKRTRCNLRKESNSAPDFVSNIVQGVILQPKWLQKSLGEHEAYQTKRAQRPIGSGTTSRI